MPSPAAALAAAPGGGSYASFAVPLWVWAAFAAFIVALLLIDLVLVHRTPH
ncbi:MAG: TerC family protein, partial [Actinobacteria bacterium]|nr:TerC family protein [Actinomycetota bacterium]